MWLLTLKDKTLKIVVSMEIQCFIQLFNWSLTKLHVSNQIYSIFLQIVSRNQIFKMRDNGEKLASVDSQNWHWKRDNWSNKWQIFHLCFLMLPLSLSEVKNKQTFHSRTIGLLSSKIWVLTFLFGLNLFINIRDWNKSSCDNFVLPWTIFQNCWHRCPLTFVPCLYCVLPCKTHWRLCTVANRLLSVHSIFPAIS